MISQKASFRNELFAIENPEGLSEAKSITERFVNNRYLVATLTRYDEKNNLYRNMIYCCFLQSRGNNNLCTIGMLGKQITN